MSFLSTANLDLFVNTPTAPTLEQRGPSCLRADLASSPCGWSCFSAFLNSHQYVHAFPNLHPVVARGVPGAPCVFQLPSPSACRLSLQVSPYPSTLIKLDKMWWWDPRVSMETASISSSGAQLRLPPVHSPPLPEPFALTPFPVSH